MHFKQDTNSEVNLADTIPMSGEGTRLSRTFVATKRSEDKIPQSQVPTTLTFCTINKPNFCFCFLVHINIEHFECITHKRIKIYDFSSRALIENLNDNGPAVTGRNKCNDLLPCLEAVSRE